MSKLADVSHQLLVLIETPGLCFREPSSLYVHGDGMLQLFPVRSKIMCFRSCTMLYSRLRQR